MIEDLSQAKRKYFASLRQPKRRRELGLFAIEGAKAVVELSGVFKMVALAAAAKWLEANGDNAARSEAVYKASTADMGRMTALSTPPEVIALFEMPSRCLDLKSLQGRLVVALDRVQDPGNLGTIIRACDWFGVDTILCSADTVDVYNPKVIQATMGAIGRVEVHYVDLPATLRQLSMPVYGTFLDGQDIYASRLATAGVIVMGNEGQGISPEVAACVTDRLYIPPYPRDRSHVESLNVSMATAITLSLFRSNNS